MLPFSSFTPLATNVYKGEVDVAEGKNCFWNAACSPPHPAFIPPIKPRFSQPTKNISENEDRGQAAILRPPDDVFAKGKEVPVKDSLPVREEVGGWVRQLKHCQAPNRYNMHFFVLFLSLFNLDICVCVSQDYSCKVGFLKIYFKGSRARRLKSPLTEFCIVNYASDVLDG